METKTVDYESRGTPWGQLGTDISSCQTITDALRISGLDWTVRQAPVQSVETFPVLASGYKLNIRESDNMPLGIVKDRYRVIQNDEAFAFTDSLAEEGVKFQQAGRFQQGRRVWILAKLPEKYSFGGDNIAPYILFINSHDGSTGIKVIMTPIRVICCNMLNLAIRSASRTWSAIHAGDISLKLQDARMTLIRAHSYMESLEHEVGLLNKNILGQSDVVALTDYLLPVDEKMSDLQKRNVLAQKEELLERYYHAPDLVEMPNTAYRYINAVSDFATHAEPLRKRKNYQEALFSKAIEGHALIDKAYQVLGRAV